MVDARLRSRRRDARIWQFRRHPESKSMRKTRTAAKRKCPIISAWLPSSRGSPPLPACRSRDCESWPAGNDDPRFAPSLRISASPEIAVAPRPRCRMAILAVSVAFGFQPKAPAAGARPRADLVGLKAQPTSRSATPGPTEIRNDGVLAERLAEAIRENRRLLLAPSKNCLLFCTSSSTLSVFQVAASTRCSNKVLDEVRCPKGHFSSAKSEEKRRRFGEAGNLGAPGRAVNAIPPVRHRWRASLALSEWPRCA